MITEDYISFEIAKLLKEKGFNEPCNAVYRKTLKDNKFIDEPDFHITTFIKSNSELLESGFKDIVFCSAPSLALVMKWLREVYNLFVSINIIPHTTVTMEQKYFFFVIFKDRRRYNFPLDYTTEFYQTPEEACEAAIKYCLEKLI